MYFNNEFNHPHDQGTLRYAAYNSDMRVATLTPEYNFRLTYEELLKSSKKIDMKQNIKIIHNRDTVRDFLNHNKDFI